MSRIKVIFDGFETPQQASAFIDWYQAQGEEASQVWMEEHSDLKIVEGTHRYGDFEKQEMTLLLKLHKK